MSDRIVPPRIPNSEYHKHLGSGGFADVFLYRQRMPERDIAVKVIRPDASAEENGAFEAEANLMAKMSAHPSILSVFGAGVSDDNRSYLIMEYCPPPHLGVRAKKQQLPVPRVLDIGIRIAGAVETLHRSGILHRDIKPANILITQFGHPVLTDFGIAVSTQPGANQGDSGFSVPWAPPEQATGQGPFGPGMDVYSLAATIHTLLTGHSPFEIPGGDNREISMLNRVLRSPVPKTGRTDVPPELERILTIAMAKDPGQRYPSMMDFALALQQVQVDMHQRTTPIDVLEDRVVDDLSDEGEDATRARAFMSIDPDGPITGPGPTRNVRDIPSDDGTRSVIRRIDPVGGNGEFAVEVDEATRVGRAALPPAEPTAWAPAAQRFSSDTATNGAPTSSAPPLTPAAASPSWDGGEGLYTDVFSEVTISRPVGQQPPVTPTVSVPAYAASTASAPMEELSPHQAAEKEIVEETPSEVPARSPLKVIVAVLATLILVGAIVFGVWSVLRDEGGTENPAEDTSITERPDALPTSNNAEPVSGLAGTLKNDGNVEFSWDSQGEGAEYLYRLIDPLENHQVRQTKDTTVSVTKLDGRTCLEVIVRHSNGKTSDPTTGCVDTP